MRIAQVAPLYESVPPTLYGGTERVVSYLTEELVSQGHEVVLYASGDSRTAAELRAPIARALRLVDHYVDGVAPHIALVERVFREAAEFDVIHFHVDYLHFQTSRRMITPHITTLHGRLDIPELLPLYREFSDMPLVSISNSQRRPLPFCGWQRTVHHGLPTDLYAFHAEPDDYLAFIGRISPEKGVDVAIRTAEQLGYPLRIAAKVDRADREYFEHLRPLFAHPGVEFIGEIGDREKNDFLGNARALLFPIEWEEPFGLVMIEALACGTPIIACGRGAVPEILDHGQTGLIGRTVTEAIASGPEIGVIDRQYCRRTFEDRFTARKMAARYVGVYEDMIHTQAFAREYV